MHREAVRFRIRGIADSVSPPQQLRNLSTNTGISSRSWCATIFPNQACFCVLLQFVQRVLV